MVSEQVTKEDNARLERIRQDVAARMAADKAQDERNAYIAQLRQRIPVELNQRQLDDARTNLRAALAEYMRVCRDYDTRHVELWNELLNLSNSGDMPADMAALATYGGVVSADGVDYRASRLQVTLATSAREIFRVLYPRHGWDLGRPQD
jgi:hypothetical protein